MTPQASLSPRAWAELFLLSLIWGALFPAVSVALGEVGVFTLVAFRVAGGGLILWIYVLLSKLPIPKAPKVWGAFLVMGLLNNAIPFSLIAWGQLRIDSGLAAILNASTAVFAVLVAAAVFADERLTAKKFAGVMLGFFGVATALGLSALKRFDLTSLAQLAVLGASISYAFAGAWARSHLRGLPPQVAAAGMAGFSGLIMSALAVYFDGVPSFDYAPATWAALIYMALMATAFAYLLVLPRAGDGRGRQFAVGHAADRADCDSARRNHFG